MKKIISILLVIVMVLSLGTVAFATEGQETGRLGTQTAADRVQAYEKEVAVSRIMEIREKYFESNGVLSDEELSEIHALIAEVYPDADSTPSRRICYYYDSNNQKNNLGDRHMRISFGSMAVLCNDRGLIY